MSRGSAARKAEFGTCQDAAIADGARSVVHEDVSPPGIVLGPVPEMRVPAPVVTVNHDGRDPSTATHSVRVVGTLYAVNAASSPSPSLVRLSTLPVVVTRYHWSGAATGSVAEMDAAERSTAAAAGDAAPPPRRPSTGTTSTAAATAAAIPTRTAVLRRYGVRAGDGTTSRTGLLDRDGHCGADALVVVRPEVAGRIGCAQQGVELGGHRDSSGTSGRSTATGSTGSGTCSSSPARRRARCRRTRAADGEMPRT